ncbi:hypothetical protein [Bacillus pseudomycoides]|uniref:hypothetical protein n=1 Tax=Bacillus pseudomycoides TaxID=64104 RepID=UPI0015D49EF4|nr:hypothetical protein [Bacillus pseudomycoides]
MNEKELSKLVKRAFSGDKKAVEKYLRLTATKEKAEDKPVMEVIDEIVSGIE